MSFGTFNGKEFTTINDFTHDTLISVEKQDYDGGKPSSYIKDDLETVTIKISLKTYRVGDIKAEANEWKKICKSKVPDMLVISGEAVSSNRMILKKVSEGSYIYSGETIIGMELNLEFEEFVRYGAKKEEGSSSKSSGKSSGKSSKSRSKKKSKKDSSSTTLTSDQEAKISALEDSIFS